MDAPRVLVTGGAGYIGSHTAKLLRSEGIEPVVYDNLTTGNRSSVRWGPFVEGDVLDSPSLIEVIEKYAPDAVIHFAASAYVGESVQNPAKYYNNNVCGTLSLIDACRQTGLRNVIFSSSCAVYGVPSVLPIDETMPKAPINPYGMTKLIGEHMLADYAAAFGLRYVALRYFNACGADPDGELGEWHVPETHLIPRALLAAAGRIPHLEIFGDDYDTPDGTCIRDYIHVADLARAHVQAFTHLANGGSNLAVNLGTGRGFSIGEVLRVIEETTGCEVPVVIHPRRPGDPPSLYADASLARETLCFQPRYSDLETIVRTAAPFFGLEARANEPAITQATHAPEPCQEPLLVPVLTGYRRAEYLFSAAVWACAFAYFWIWWLEPRHHVDAFGTITVSLVLAWVTALPAYFIVVFYRAARPNGPLRLPAGSRVAMVVTKAPSEPFSVVSETLLAMLAQDVEHDTWLADEDPSPETLDWCSGHGVFVSTRKGRSDYHRTSWPRRTRCKEGNLAFFYDHYGYSRYDFVAQLDADHVPAPDYLFHMLRPFADPKVGYVSAPSICDKNASESWSARGRLYAEASMHGSLQAGYNDGLAPLCIGSHYAVRTVALKQIGGLGPELAEDHSTTLMMNAGGWRGVHALDAIAHGDGPRTFSDLVTQEFQWSRSLVMLLLRYSPSLVGRLPPRLRFQFLFFATLVSHVCVFHVAHVCDADHRARARPELRDGDLSRFPRAFRAAFYRARGDGLSLARQQLVSSPRCQDPELGMHALSLRALALGARRHPGCGARFSDGLLRRFPRHAKRAVRSRSAAGASPGALRCAGAHGGIARLGDRRCRRLQGELLLYRPERGNLLRAAAGHRRAPFEGK